MEQYIKKRDKVIVCYHCGRQTMKLHRKKWKKRPYKHYIELLGFYKCTNCGNNCSKVFEREPI